MIDMDKLLQERNLKKIKRLPIKKLVEQGAERILLEKKLAK